MTVYDTGSLSKAARQMRLSQPTVGRHIQELEMAIGRPLFARSQVGLRPTTLATSLAPTARVMANTASSLERRATANEADRAGTIRLSASEIVGVELLPAILMKLRKKYPAIEIELNLNNLQDDLLTRSTDIAIRMTNPTQERLVCKKLGTARLGLYAHKSYLENQGAPQNIKDLASCDLIGVDRDLDRLSDFDLFDRAVKADDFTFRCDNDLGQLAALRAGLGIAVCQYVIAKDAPNLIRVLPSVSFDLPVWLAKHEDMKGDPIVELTYQFLAQQLQIVYAAPANS